ncbi:MAG TPA: hypothetical protein VHP99_12505 [Pyrinomonadaceae bacterium]|jgi:hypothetical protein|nr:hypothetical protein [Pyrinomonadaceae bacterium]
MRRIIVVICIVMFLSTATMAQSRARRTTKHPATTSKTTTTTEAAATVRTEGATRIASQIKSLSKFLYLVGGVVRGIEAIDAAAKDGQASPTNEKNKAQLRGSFTDFRIGLDSLEVYFRSTPELQPYYTKLVGSASGAATAEQQAAAGQFNQACNTMLGVVGRLTDVLVAMP